MRSLGVCDALQYREWMLTTGTIIVELLGWAGVLLYVIAYYCVSTGRFTGQSRIYQFLNLIGAFGVAANAFYYGAYPSAIVNVIWFAIAAATLLHVLRASDDRDPAHPASPEGQNMYRLLFFAGCFLAVFGLALAVIALMPRPPRPMQPVQVFAPEWEPYVSRSDADGGPLTALVRELFRGINYDARVVFTDWDDALRRVEDGTGVAAFPFIDHRDRAERLLFTEPLMHFQYVLFYRRGIRGPDGIVDKHALLAWLDALSGNGEWDAPPLRLGAVAGYALWPELAEIATIDERFDTPAEGFRMLERGEIDLLAEGLLVGQRTIEDPATKVNAANITAAALDDPRAGAPEALRLVTRMTRSGEELRYALNARLAELEHRGELRELQYRIETISRVQVMMRDVTTAHRPDDAHQQPLTLPAGTRAYVRLWPHGFGAVVSTQQHDDPDEHRCLVKILNGPMRGWEVLVEPESFVIVESGVQP